MPATTRQSIAACRLLASAKLASCQRLRKLGTPPDNGWEVPFEIFGKPSGQQERLRANFISPEYFTVLQIPLLQGRLMDESEVARGARLAVVNQTMAVSWTRVAAK